MVRKIILSLLFIFNYSSIQAAQDVRDDQGRTPLMNLVIERQANMDKKWDAIYFLWHECFFWELCFGTTSARKQYSFSIKKFEALLAAEQDLKQYLADTLVDIDVMIDSGVQINVRDHHAKSVLDYCEYKALRDYFMAHGAMLGAEMVFFSNREELLLSGFIILSIPFVVAAIVIINSYQEDWD